MNNNNHHKSNNNVHMFKTTFIKRHIFINRRTYDSKWEVVMHLTSPTYTKDPQLSVYNGKEMDHPLRWITVAVYSKRYDALCKAKELSKVKKSY